MASFKTVQICRQANSSGATQVVADFRLNNNPSQAHRPQGQRGHSEPVASSHPLDGVVITDDDCGIDPGTVAESKTGPPKVS